MSQARITTAIVLFAAGLGTASAQNFGPWSDPQPVDAIDTDAAEGCPIEAPDGLSLYFASNRADASAQGKLDLWRAHRAAVASPWGAAENLGAPVNTGEFDYCPTPLADGALLYVSSQQTPDDCFPGDTPPAAPPGGPSAGDMFATREDPAHTWSTPVNLGCYPDGPNTPGAEFSPSRVQTTEGTFLFFSSNGYPDSQGQDIYMSQVLDDGSVTAGVRVSELSTPADDRMPNVRADGLEIVFSSNRSGGTHVRSGHLRRHACRHALVVVGAAADRQPGDQHDRVGNARLAIGRWDAALLRPQGQRRRSGRCVRRHARGCRATRERADHPGFTGAWYDPQQSGHGLFLEVLTDNRILAWWFTFNPDGTQQSWFGNVGAINGDTATSLRVQTEGGRWIPNFDHANVTQPPWGTLTIHVHGLQSRTRRFLVERRRVTAKDTWI